jgi:hypothetical protein
MILKFDLIDPIKRNTTGQDRKDNWHERKIIRFSDNFEDRDKMNSFG